MKRSPVAQGVENSLSFYQLLLVLLLVIAPAGYSSAKITEEPQKIVSLGPINTENIYLLGAGDRLVGSTVYCVRPKEAQDTLKVGSVMQVSVEKIMAQEPDLVLATDLTPESQVSVLERVGLKVVRIQHPRSFAESCDQLEELGRLLGLEKEALRITTELRVRVAEIQERVEKLRQRPPRVLLQIGASPLYVSGKDSFTHDFIALLGAQNIMGDQLSGRIGYEQAIAADPDVILIGIMGSEGGIAAQEKEKWQALRVIEAAQKKRIHIVNPNLVCSPSPATFVEALERIEPLLYPPTHQGG